jgi:hypothetical protein
MWSVENALKVLLRRKRITFGCVSRTKNPWQIGVLPVCNIVLQGVLSRDRALNGVAAVVDQKESLPEMKSRFSVRGPCAPVEVVTTVDVNFTLSQ